MDTESDKVTLTLSKSDLKLLDSFVRTALHAAHKLDVCYQRGETRNLYVAEFEFLAIAVSGDKDLAIERLWNDVVATRAR